MPTHQPSHLIGARLRERRIAAGVRQAELAVAAGISASYLNLIEHDRRNLSADVLARIAAALHIDVQVFHDHTAPGLLADLRSAAARISDATAETDRIEELASRFPGWAGVITGLLSQAEGLERAVAALNDRLGHDPHLSSALHELLTALSAVRATSAILVETEDLTPDWQRRFHKNLHEDSERLAQGAEALVAWLDHAPDHAADRAVSGLTSAQDQLDHWLSGRGWHLPELEPGASADDLARIQAEIAALPSAEARSLAKTHVEAQTADARAMPMGAFVAAMMELGADPAALAQRFGTGVIAAMRRMALLPGATDGFVLCDASGTPLFRKPAPGFSLPKFGAACPLWPLFGALARPGQPMAARVETPAPGGGRFQCLAFCESRLPFGFGGPELRLAAMLIRPDLAGGASVMRAAGQGASLPFPQASGLPLLPLGATCRICPRSGCPARREPSILG